MEYLLYFSITIILSTIFAIAGLGSAIALVPTLNFSGLSFELARASGLFVNFISTFTVSIINFQKKLFDKQFVAPLVVSSMIFAYMGAKVSLGIDTNIVKNIFGITLIFIATMILFLKIKTNEEKIFNQKLLYIVGSIGGFFSGFLGVGGGSIISPLLILLGYDAKKIALGISFVIPFSSIVAFWGYATVIEIDMILLSVLGVGAYLGGVLGNYLLHYKVSSSTIKKILAVVLYIIAAKMVLMD